MLYILFTLFGLKANAEIPYVDIYDVNHKWVFQLSCKNKHYKLVVNEKDAQSEAVNNWIDLIFNECNKGALK